MRRMKYGISALVCLVTLLMSTFSVSAAEIVDYTQYGFETADSIDFKVLSSSSFSVIEGAFVPDVYENEVGLYADVELAHSLTDSYKIIEYEVGDGWNNIAYFTKSQEDVTAEYVDATFTDSNWNQQYTIEQILANSDVVGKDTYLHLFLRGEDYASTNYLCIFSADATDMSGLIGVIPFSELFTPKYIETFSELPSIDYPEPSFNVVMNSAFKDELGVVYGGEFSFSYQFSDYTDTNGVLAHEYPVSIVINNEFTKIVDTTGKSGTVTFDFYTTANGSYPYVVQTNVGNEYKGTFEFSAIADSEDEKEIEISDEVPVVTFSDLPSKEDKGTTVTLKMNTNIKCYMSFNGDSLGNGVSGTSFTFSITENGTYNYQVWSESGLTTKGTLVIDFFTESEEEELIDDELVDELDSDDGKTDDKLFQTGMYTSNKVIVGVLMIAGVLFMSLGFKGGKKNEDDKEVF